MSARPAPALRRDPEHGILGGVCAGIARQVGVDALVVRIAFIAAAFAGGLGFVLYVIAWLLVPATGDARPPRVRRLAGRGAVEVAVGVGLLVLATLLTFRALGLWWSDTVVWPVVLVAAGGALLWHESLRRAPEPAPDEAEPAAAAERERPAATVSRTGLGIALVIAAGVVFLGATNALSGARDVVLSVLVVALVLVIVFAPWILRLARSLAAERSERIRSEERAEMAAHLHDSVLQTLALVQQRAEDPRAVATLARRQERELRAWLAQRPGTEATHLAPALEGVAGEVERDHGVAVEVVVVGDAELDERARALVAAAREAMVNAAKFGAGSPVDVFAEVLDDELQVYVRDRGPGFALGEVPDDRRGVRDSIVGRMTRHGGRAAVHSGPGQGTEVELAVPR